MVRHSHETTTRRAASADPKVTLSVVNLIRPQVVAIPLRAGVTALVSGEDAAVGIRRRDRVDRRAPRKQSQRLRRSAVVLQRAQIRRLPSDDGSSVRRRGEAKRCSRFVLNKVRAFQTEWARCIGPRRCLVAGDDRSQDCGGAVRRYAARVLHGNATTLIGVVAIDRGVTSIYQGRKLGGPQCIDPAPVVGRRIVRNRAVVEIDVGAEVLDSASISLGTVLSDRAPMRDDHQEILDTPAA